jgi:hypothetical protein
MPDHSPIDETELYQRHGLIKAQYRLRRDRRQTVFLFRLTRELADAHSWRHQLTTDNPCAMSAPQCKAFVADRTRAARAGCHRAGIGIGEGDLLIKAGRPVASGCTPSNPRSARSSASTKTRLIHPSANCAGIISRESNPAARFTQPGPKPVKKGVVPN